jgi:hypothetical protein
MSKNQGYIKLFRDIQNNFLWSKKPFDKPRAFVDILLLANHTDNTILINGKQTVIKRGQYHTSRKKLADRWGWEVKTVDRFLGVLKGAEMVTYTGDPFGITLTVENYDIYQGDGDTKSGHPKYTPRDNGRHTNNKLKNENNPLDTSLKVSNGSKKKEKEPSKYVLRNDLWDDDPPKPQKPKSQYPDRNDVWGEPDEKPKKQPSKYADWNDKW